MSFPLYSSLAIPTLASSPHPSRAQLVPSQGFPSHPTTATEELTQIPNARVSKTIKRQMLFGLHDDAEDEDVGGARTMALADGTFSDTLVPGGGDSQADRQPKRAREESETPAKVPTRATDVRPRRSLNRMYDRMNQRLIAAMPQREQDGVEGHPRNENAVPVARKATAGRLSLREHTTATPDAAEGLRHTQTAMLNHQSGMITSLRLSSRAGRSPSPALLAQAAIMHSANRGHTTPVLSSEPNWAHATPVLFSEPGQTRKISSSTLQTASDTHLHEVAPSAAPSNPPIQLPVRTSSPEPDFVKMGAALRDEDAIVPKFRPAAVARAEEHLHDARKKVAPFMTAALYVVTAKLLPVTDGAGVGCSPKGFPCKLC
ncbi:hypothetical protein, variant 3 [Capsaspora owczarzaki ATCC 30864]|uniref:Uncharacterized protein n=1 Tax=Capsaspora owczarzaki (strain ATCC 30864) TaxID=595528 RepID=A0A0D2WYJ1_CAPO3|nr:hypothetical protein, variant 3 [Capsaspora owczarzaki ATCC 30864]